MQRVEYRRAAGVKKGSVEETQPMKRVRVYLGKQERSKGIWKRKMEDKKKEGKTVWGWRKTLLDWTSI